MVVADRLAPNGRKRKCSLPACLTFVVATGAAVGSVLSRLFRALKETRARAANSSLFLRLRKAEDCVLSWITAFQRGFGRDLLLRPLSVHRCNKRFMANRSPSDSRIGRGRSFFLKSFNNIYATARVVCWSARLFFDHKRKYFSRKQIKHSNQVLAKAVSRQALSCHCSPVRFCPGQRPACGSLRTRQVFIWSDAATPSCKW